MPVLPSRFVLAALALVAATHGPSAGATQSSAQPAAKASVVRVLPLPPMDGANLKVHVVQVTYPPGAMSMAHRHPCPVVGYVISGTMRMQVSDQPVAEYKAGDTFFELPTDVHRMGSNPSKDTPAIFTATFVCDKDTPLSVPVPDTPAQ